MRTALPPTRQAAEPCTSGTTTRSLTPDSAPCPARPAPHRRRELADHRAQPHLRRTTTRPPLHHHHRTALRPPRTEPLHHCPPSHRRRRTPGRRRPQHRLTPPPGASV